MYKRQAFAFDGDADRCIAVDENGKVVDGDLILYVCGKYLKEQGRLEGDTIEMCIRDSYVITEITCHARGGREFAGNDCAVIDVGGQDTKVIILEDGMVKDFLMNDKCSAGTGKFLEIMANRLGVTLQELFEMADQGTILPISSLCTVCLLYTSRCV